MAGALRRLAGAAARSLRSTASSDPALQAPAGGIPSLPPRPPLQVRSVGDMPRREDPFIEAWSARREAVEHDFVWDWTTVRNVVFWVVAVPAAIYKGVVAEFNHVDDLYGRKRRDFL